MMTEFFSFYVPLFSVLGIYTAVIYGLAFLARRRTRGVSDYVLGGRNVGGFVTALSAGASDMSSWLLMALPGMVMVRGLGVVWLPLSLTVGAYVNWVVVARRLRVYTEVLGDVLTIPAYLGCRFGGMKRGLQLLSGVVMMFFFCFYAVAGFVSAGKLMGLTLGVGYGWGLWGSGLFIVMYTAVGGFLAVSWVDVFQGILMFCALLVVPLVVYVRWDNFAGGVGVLGGSGGYWDVCDGVSLCGVVSLFAWGLGYVGQPHIIGRFMAIRSVGELSLARRVCTVWMALAMGFAFAVGLVGAVVYGRDVVWDCEMVFLVLSKGFFNVWLYAVLLCAVLSSIMSTVSCLILMAANALVEDFYGAWLGSKGSSGGVGWHRVGVLVVSFVSLVMASSPRLSIMDTVAFPWCGLGASLGPVVVMSLYWRRMTWQGAMAGIVLGGGFVMVWEVLGRMGNGYVNHPDVLPGFCLFPAFVVGVVAIVVVSYGTSVPSEGVVKGFEAMRERLAKEV